MHGHAADITPGVETGLASFYFLVFLTNLGFALYQQLVAKNARLARFGYVLAAVFFIHSALYLVARVGALGSFEPVLPAFLRDMSDYGLARGLITLGIADPRGIVVVFVILFYVILILGAADLVASYLAGPKARETVDRLARPVFNGLETDKRVMAWVLAGTLLGLLLSGTNAITVFVLAVVAFIAFLVWRKPLTEPAVAWGALNLGLLYGGWSMTDWDFRQIISKPDNVPIAGLIFVLGFFTWLAFRRGVINDERIAQGLPPMEKVEDEKVLVWPDLVYTELICMVVITVVLVVWSVGLPAPLEQPASGTKTPNPSKAPWYFLGLQEMLVYYDPWIAGVVLPTFIIIGLMAMPYIDFNQKGVGYFTFAERKFAIFNFLFGFLVLWSTMIFLMTVMRGPNQNFFGLYETWDTHKVVPANNVNLSDYFWIQGLGMLVEPPEGEKPSVPLILLRESPGILLVLAYFLLVPPLLAKTLLRTFFIRMGFVRYMVLLVLILFMASLPIKMVLRWTINLKYIVAITEADFNI